MSSAQAPSSGGGGGVTFPLLAPNGTAAAPSYSFSAETGMGLFKADAQSLNIQAPNDGVASNPGIINLTTSPTSGVSQQTQIAMGPFWTAGQPGVGVVNKLSSFKADGTVTSYRIVVNPDAGVAHDHDLRIKSNDQIDRVLISPAGGPIFPNTSSSTPIQIVKSGGTIGTDETDIFHGDLATFGGSAGHTTDVTQINSVPTGSNVGGVVINAIKYFNNTALNNTSLGAEELVVPSGGGGGTNWILRTNDNLCNSGVGCISMNPAAGTGRNNITFSHNNGADVQFANGAGTTFASMRPNSSSFSFGSGGFGVFQWQIDNATGNWFAVTDATNDLGGNSNRPRNVFASRALRTGTTANTDSSGTITVTSSTTGSTTFPSGVTYTTAPRCVLTPTSDPTAVGVWWVTSSTTAVTATVKVSGTITFNYECWQLN